MKRMLGLLAVCLMAAGMASAQTGAVAGLVLDDLGSAVEGARVSLHADGACVAHVFTGADGAYLFEEVAVGFYTVKAGLPQVGTASIEDVEVIEGQTTQVPDLVLAGAGGGGGSGSGPHGTPPKFRHQNQHQNQQGGE